MKSTKDQKRTEKADRSKVSAPATQKAPETAPEQERASLEFWRRKREQFLEQLEKRMFPRRRNRYGWLETRVPGKIVKSQSIIENLFPERESSEVEDCWMDYGYRFLFPEARSRRVLGLTWWSGLGGSANIYLDEIPGHAYLLRHVDDDLYGEIFLAWIPWGAELRSIVRELVREYFLTCGRKLVGNRLIELPPEDLTNCWPQAVPRSLLYEWLWQGLNQSVGGGLEGWGRIEGLITRETDGKRWVRRLERLRVRLARVQHREIRRLVKLGKLREEVDTSPRRGLARLCPSVYLVWSANGATFDEEKARGEVVDPAEKEVLLDAFFAECYSEDRESKPTTLTEESSAAAEFLPFPPDAFARRAGRRKR